jgi:hypothetical protein
VKTPAAPPTVVVPTTQGDALLLDQADAQLLAQFTIGRATGGDRRPVVNLPQGSRPKRPPVARFLCGPMPTWNIVQHINGDVMDCRRSNMRVAQNASEALETQVRRRNAPDDALMLTNPYLLPGSRGPRFPVKDWLPRWPR